MKKKFLLIFFVIIILFVFFIILVNWHQKKINGGADGGYYSEGHYYIYTYSDEFKEVTKTTWYISKVLWRVLIVFYFLFGICFIIFMLTIAFPFIIKLNKEFIKENKWK